MALRSLRRRCAGRRPLKLRIRLLLAGMIVCGHIIWRLNGQLDLNDDLLLETSFGDVSINTTKSSLFTSSRTEDVSINTTKSSLFTSSRTEDLHICDVGLSFHNESQTNHVDCADIIRGEKLAQVRAKKFLSSHRHPGFTDIKMMDKTENCSEYTANTFYPAKPLTGSEAQFPIAYSIIVHRDAYQLEKLLRAIYWPQNWYCIHLDRKSNAILHQFVSNIVSCLPHVVVPAKKEAVFYGGISRLKADLNCMEELFKENRTWKYLINLTGQEYPLKTNAELVTILKSYHSASDIENEPKSKLFTVMDRYKYHWKFNNITFKARIDKNTLKSAPPRNITLVKGSAFGAFTRDFVKFVITDTLVGEFLSWLEDTWSPDEVFWGTVSNFKPVVFRIRAHNRTHGLKEKWQAKYAVWPPAERCHGVKVHWSCVFSYLDIPYMVNKPHLFANKFNVNYDHLALDCLEQWLHNRTYHRFNCR